METSGKDICILLFDCLFVIFPE